MSATVPTSLTPSVPWKLVQGLRQLNARATGTYLLLDILERAVRVERLKGPGHCQLVRQHRDVDNAKDGTQVDKPAEAAKPVSRP